MKIQMGASLVEKRNAIKSNYFAFYKQPKETQFRFQLIRPKDYSSFQYVQRKIFQVICLYYFSS